MPATSSRLIFTFLIDTVILLICALGLVQNHYKAGLNPETHISFDVQEHRMTVSQVHDVQFSQLEPNDLVKSIAGFSPHSKEELEFILDGYAIDDRIEMVIGRGDDEMTIQIIRPYFRSSCSTGPMLGDVFAEKRDGHARALRRARGAELTTCERRKLCRTNQVMC